MITQLAISSPYLAWPMDMIAQSFMHKPITNFILTSFSRNHEVPCDKEVIELKAKSIAKCVDSVKS